MDDSTLYRSYLIRLWRRSGERASTWSVALEDVRTGERRSFASLDEALRYLGARLKDAERLSAHEEPP